MTAGGNPMDIKRGIDQAVEASPSIDPEDVGRPVQGAKAIAQVGSISANNDTMIGKIIAEAMDKVGKDGVITVEEAKWPRDRRSRSSRACSSTAATSRRTS